MRYLRVRLDQPQRMRHPMQSFLAASPAMERVELRAWNLSRDDVGFALFYAVGDVDAYRDRIEGVEQVRAYELAPVDDRSFYAYVCDERSAGDETFREAFAELRLVVIPPLVYEGDGRVLVTAVGAGEALQTLTAALREESDVGVDVAAVGSFDRPRAGVTGALTDRQYDAVTTATRMGYYDVPRKASLSAVADELGVVHATASELLRRGESRLMSGLLSRG